MHVYQKLAKLIWRVCKTIQERQPEVCYNPVLYSSIINILNLTMLGMYAYWANNSLVQYKFLKVVILAYMSAYGEKRTGLPNISSYSYHLRGT